MAQKRKPKLAKVTLEEMFRELCKIPDVPLMETPASAPSTEANRAGITSKFRLSDSTASAF